MKRDVWILKLLFLVQLAAAGAFMNYINLYLEQVIELTGSQIGLVQMVSLIFLVLVNPIWGLIADKTGKYNLLLRISLLSAVFVALMYFHVHTFALIVVVAVIFECVRAGIIPLSEVITTNYCERVGYDFSKVRVFGSIGWMLGGMLVGFLIDGMSFDFAGIQFNFDGMFNLGLAMFGTYIVFRLIGLGLAFFMPKDQVVASDEQDNGASEDSRVAKSGMSDLRILLANKRFMFIMFLIAISITTVDTANGYSAMHLVTTLGAQPSIISWFMFAAVMPEIIFLPFGGFLTRKLGFKNVYYIAIMTMLVRIGVYSFTTSTTVFLVVSMVHVFGVIMHVSGNIAYIRKVVPAGQMALAFTVMSSIVALTRAILGFIFGWIYENTSSFMMFRVTGIILIVALLVVMRSKSLSDFEASSAR